MEAQIILDKETMKAAFAEVAPLYVALPILNQWLDKRGFWIVKNGPEWRVYETSASQDGMVWGQLYFDYATCLTAVLDEIVRRAKEGNP
jgi:hypothetical protein